MAAVNYGKIAITNGGEWVDSREYNVLTTVSYLGSTYITKVISPIGTLPTDANYWQLWVQGAEVATEESIGVVRPDGESILVDGVGGVSIGKLNNATTDFVEAETEENIVSGDDNSTVLGKLLKSINTFRDGLANKISTSKIVNTTAVTEAGFVPDALLVKTNAEAISTLTNNLAGQVFLASDITVATGYSILSGRFSAKVVNGRIMLYAHIAINTGTIPTGVFPIITGIPSALNPSMPMFAYAIVDGGDFETAETVPIQLSGNQININIKSAGKTRIGLLIECSK